jgi:hypothetical protein
MVCRNLCERLYSKIVFGKSHYEGGRKYCRRCEVYYYHDGVFCRCRGMALRMSPTSKRDKERLRQLQLRRGEDQDRITTIAILTENFRSVLIVLLFILFFSIFLESLFTLPSLS